MKKIDHFQRGMGIGGWLTNYKRFHVLPQERRLTLTVGDMEHFEGYITEADVRYIAELGMDHVRLGFDQIVVEEAPKKKRTTKKKAEETPVEEAPAAEGEEAPAPKKRATRKKKTEEIDPSVD